MSSAEGSSAISVDKDYVKTKTGLLRIVQAVISICAIICISSTGICWYYERHQGRFGFFEFVAVETFIYALILLLLFLFRVQETLARCINVPLTIVINDSIQAVLYLIAAILALISTCYYGGQNAAAKIAGIFGLLGVLAFAYSAFLHYQAFHGGTTTTTTVRKTTVVTTA